MIFCRGFTDMNKCFSLNDAVFTYILSPSESPLFAQHSYFAGGTLTISHTPGTQVRSCKTEDCEIAVIGLCVDAYGQLERDEIPSFLLHQAFENTEQMYRFCSRFAGKYVMIYKSGKDFAVWGDATGSLQINYAFRDEEMCLASVDKLAADHMNYNVSEYSKAIRQGAEFSQGMPDDLTMYDEIKVLLPNHYLDVLEKKPVRVEMDFTEYESETDLDGVIAATDRMVRVITREYTKYYELVCPLTSGYDSRLVFAFLSEAIQELTCYTFQHPGFTENTGDVWVPRKLCELAGKHHRLINDKSVPEEYRADLEKVIGSYHAKRTMDLAYTFNSAFRGKALINGDIIDQVGKSLLGNTVPTKLASSWYFQCKIHNHHPDSRRELEHWMESICAAGQREQVFDLFAIENRCGRWASQTSMIYSACGINALNIFNCAELIHMWAGIPRQYRVNQVVHRKLFEKKDSRLMQVPFNPDEREIDILKKHWVTFYLATFAKFTITKLRRKFR